MEYQDKNFEYINAEAYDKRGETSVLERYVLGLWQPFLKNKISELSADKIIIDLGCGTCEYTKAAASAKKIYAVDISEAMLEVCKGKLNNLDQAEVIENSILTTNLPTADLIITIGIWEYISPVDLYEKIKNITRQGSKVIAVFPNIYNKFNFWRNVFKMRKVALWRWAPGLAIRPGFIKKLFKNDFLLIDADSFGTVSWCPKKLQFLILPIWKFGDWLWRPFQKFLPLGVNVYYLFERK